MLKEARIRKPLPWLQTQQQLGNNNFSPGCYGLVGDSKEPMSHTTFMPSKIQEQG
jgi:hypothetical protein